MNTNNQTPLNISLWMPLRIGDTRQHTIGQPPEFVGMYINLMMAAWQNGGQLPDDEKQLARISGASPEQWIEYRQALANLFAPRNGTWSHNGIREELTKAQKIRADRTEAGRIGSTKRWSEAKGKAKAATDQLLTKISQDGAAY